jgi:hypothetical protein
MDLKEILNYRNNCIICKNKMVYVIKNYPNLVFKTDKKGFHINSGNNFLPKSGIQLDFNFDGSFYRNKRNYKIYTEPLQIVKMCRTCPVPAIDFTYKNFLLKSTNPIGLTNSFIASLNNVKNLECFYTFQLTGGVDIYSRHINYDIIRYHDKDSFYHVELSYLTNSSILYYGNFHNKVDDILIIHIPSIVSLANINSIEDFIKKYKLLITFS